jgi:hypothetical protein
MTGNVRPLSPLLANGKAQRRTGDVAGRGEHGGAVPVGLHRATAAGAAVADGIEPAEHGIFVLVDTIEHIPAP